MIAVGLNLLMLSAKDILPKRAVRDSEIPKSMSVLNVFDCIIIDFLKAQILLWAKFFLFALEMEFSIRFVISGRIKNTQTFNDYLNFIGLV